MAKSNKCFFFSSDHSAFNDLCRLTNGIRSANRRARRNVCLRHAERRKQRTRQRRPQTSHGTLRTSISLPIVFSAAKRREKKSNAIRYCRRPRQRSLTTYNHQYHEPDGRIFALIDRAGCGAPTSSLVSRCIHHCVCLPVHFVPHSALPQHRCVCSATSGSEQAVEQISSTSLNAV